MHGPCECCPRRPGPCCVCGGWDDDPQDDGDGSAVAVTMWLAAGVIAVVVMVAVLVW